MHWSIDEIFDMRKGGFEWTDIADVTGLTAIQAKNLVVNLIYEELYPSAILE